MGEFIEWLNEANMSASGDQAIRGLQSSMMGLRSYALRIQNPQIQQQIITLISGFEAQMRPVIARAAALQRPMGQPQPQPGMKPGMKPGMRSQMGMK